MKKSSYLMRLRMSVTGSVYPYDGHFSDVGLGVGVGVPEDHPVN
jgi:hypothetical protein